MDVLKEQKTDFREIIYEKGNWVARITINRPQVYNSYSTNALEELAAAFRQAAFDDEVADIVYTGAGDKAFCTGGDGWYPWHRRVQGIGILIRHD